MYLHVQASIPMSEEESYSRGTLAFIENLDKNFNPELQ